MKTLNILIAFLFLSVCTNAQVGKDSTTGAKETTKAEDDNKIFNAAEVEVEASFPGGDAAWRTYLQNNIDPNTPIKHRAKRGTYQVIIRFIVNKEGAISDVRAETSFGHGMEAEAIRVIENGPKWTPAFQKGRKVNAYRRQPITFVVQ